MRDCAIGLVPWVGAKASAATVFQCTTALPWRLRAARRRGRPRRGRRWPSVIAAPVTARREPQDARARRRRREVGMSESWCRRVLSRSEERLNKALIVATRPASRQSRNRPGSVHSCHSTPRRHGHDLDRAERLACSDPRGTPRRACVALPDAVVSTLAGIYDVMNALRADGPAERAGARAPFHVEIVGEAVGPARRWPAACRSTCSARSTPSRRRDIVIVPSVLLRRGLAEGPLSRAWSSGCSAMHDTRRGALLGLLGHLPARGDGPVRRQGRHGALRLRARRSRPRIRRCRSIRSACW